MKQTLFADHDPGSSLTPGRSLPGGRWPGLRTWATLLIAVAAAALLLASWTPGVAHAAPASPPGAAATVVLVHGAWADGSSWNEVIARLQAKGLTVVSVQNPLTSLADDVAAVDRAVQAQKGPVILVGHSWGGTVITQAGMADQVVALVYVAAFAPDVGQSTNDLQKHRPPPAYAALLQVDSGGFLHFPQDALPGYFAQDLSIAAGRVLAATQQPIRASAFGDKVTAAAWRHKPAWYLVTKQDRMIDPQLQRAMAERIGAHVSTVQASHVPFASKAKETTALILAAAESVRTR